MKKLVLSLFSLSALLYSAGTYDTYVFTDDEEIYSLHFVNTALSTEISSIGLTTTDATAIIGLRPITTLLTVANNTNITGRDMLLIRSRSYAVDIPDHSVYNAYHASLGIKIYDYNFLMALMGVLMGFLFAFGLIYSILNISRHKV